MNGLTAYLAFSQIDDAYIAESTLPEASAAVILPPPASTPRRRFPKATAAVIAATLTAVLLAAGGLVGLSLRGDWFTPPADTTDTTETAPILPETEAYELLGPEDADMVDILQKAPPPAPDSQISSDAAMVGMTFTRIPITNASGTHNGVARFTLYEDWRGRDLYVEVLDKDGSILYTYTEALNDNLFLLLQSTEDETAITLLTLTASAHQGKAVFYCTPIAFKWCFPCDEEPEVNRIESILLEAGYWHSGEQKLPLSEAALANLTQRLGSYWTDLTLASLDAPGGYAALMDGMTDKDSPRVYSRAEPALSRAAAESVFATPYETLMARMCEGVNLQGGGSYTPPADGNDTEITIPSPSYDPYPDEIAAGAPAIEPDLPEDAIPVGTTVTYARMISNQYSQNTPYVSRIALYKDGSDPFVRYLYVDVLDENSQVLATHVKQILGTVLLFQSIDNPDSLVLLELTASFIDKGRVEMKGMVSNLYWSDESDTSALSLYESTHNVSDANGSWAFDFYPWESEKGDMLEDWDRNKENLGRHYGHSDFNYLKAASRRGYRILVNGLDTPHEPTVCPSELVSTEGYMDYYEYTQTLPDNFRLTFFYLLESLGYEAPDLSDEPEPPVLPDPDAVLSVAGPMTPDLPETVMMDGETYVLLPISRQGERIYAVCRVAVYRNPGQLHTQYLYLDVLDTDGTVLGCYTRRLQGLFALMQDCNTGEHLLLSTAAPTDAPGMAFTTLSLTWSDTDPATGNVSDTLTLYEAEVAEATWRMEAEPEALQREGAHTYWNTRYDNWMPKWSGCLRYWESISEDEGFIMPAGNLIFAEDLRRGECETPAVFTEESGWPPKEQFDYLTHESLHWTWMFGYCMNALGYGV